MKQKKYSKIKQKKLEQICLECIKEKNLVCYDEIFYYTEVIPSDFYFFELEKSEALNNEIEKNRAKLKAELREKWKESTNATLNVALYKLICSQEERKLLSSSSSSKAQQNDQLCTQEEYLKSLKEMGESLEVSENAD